MSKNKFQKESLFLYTEGKYVKYDLTNKNYFKMKKYINEKSQLDLDRSFMIYLTENNIKELVWTFNVDILELNK